MQLLVSHRKNIGCIVVTQMKLQEPTMAMMIGSHILPPLPEPTPSQILSTTFKAEGVCLGPEQLKGLKVLAVEQDMQRIRAKAED